MASLSKKLRPLTLSSLRAGLSQDVTELLLTAIAALLFVHFFKRSPLTIGVLAVSVSVGAFVLLKKTEYVLFFIIFILPFRDIHIVSILYVKPVLVVGLLAYTLLRQSGFQENIFSRRMRWFTKAVLLFLAALVMSIIKTASALEMTSNITLSMLKATIFSSSATIITEIFIVYLVYYSMKTVRHIHILLDVSIAASGCIAILGVWQYYSGGIPPFMGWFFDPDFEFYDRATSVFLNPNGLGSFIAPMFILSFSSFFWRTTTHRKRFALYLPILILNALALTLSFSRGGMMQVFLSLCILAYLYYSKVSRKRLSWKTLLLAFLVLTLILLAINFYDVYMRARFSIAEENSFREALLHNSTRGDSLRVRVAILAFQTFLEHPFFGIGYDLFWGAKIAGFAGLFPHNQFLKIMVEMGVMGFIPFMGMFVIAFKAGTSLWKNPKDTSLNRNVESTMFILLSVLCSLMFGYLFIDSLTNLAVAGYLWVFLGAIFALEREYLSSSETESSKMFYEKELPSESMGSVGSFPSSGS